MPFIYTRSDLIAAGNRGIQGKKGVLLDVNATANEAVREVMNEIRIRSTRRKASLVPNLYSQEYEYSCPTDLHDQAIIDIPQQAARDDGEFQFVPSEQFARWARLGDISISNYNGIRTLLINSRVTDKSTVVDALSVVATKGSSWAVLGNATTLAANSDDFIRGNASLQFNLSAASTTTAGISITATTAGAEDLSTYIGHSAAVFVYARITSTTGLTDYRLRLGTSSGAYYEFTATVKNDGTAFSTGWNLLRFDMTSYTTTGSPDSTNIKYFSIFMTKLTSKVSESGYMFNYMVAKKGKYADIIYYSKYGWTTAAGAYIENSTNDTDLLVADTDEFDLYVKKFRVTAALEADLPVAISRAGKIIDPRMNAYAEAKQGYIMRNPSEEKIMISSYYDYGSQETSYGSNSN